MTHSHGSVENLKHFYLGSRILIPLFCFSFFLRGPGGFHLGHVKNA